MIPGLEMDYSLYVLLRVPQESPTNGVLKFYFQDVKEEEKLDWRKIFSGISLIFVLVIIFIVLPVIIFCQSKEARKR